MNIKRQNTNVPLHINAVLLRKQDGFSASTVGARRIEQQVLGNNGLVLLSQATAGCPGWTHVVVP